MATFIIYCRNSNNLEQTLNDLIDKTPPEHIEQIILCDENDAIPEDTDWDIQYPPVISKTEQIGRSRAWNEAARLAKSEQLVFLTAPVKFGLDWFSPIIEQLSEKRLVSPRAFALDTNLWATEAKAWRRYGMRWSMAMYDRRFGDRSPLAAFCMVIHKQFFEEIGGFDEGAIPGPGDNICLSLKTWMAGGEVAIADESYIAIIPEVESEARHNLVRMIEAWFPKHTTHFYESCGIEPGSVEVGRIDELVRFAESSERSAQWWLENLQPELLGIYLLRNTAHGKRIAVVGDGPSLDYMSLSLINSHDIIICVDYIGLLVESNYVVTNSADVVMELRSKYVDQQFVVPYIMENRVAGEYMLASDTVPNAVQFEVGEIGDVSSVNPPFCDFGNCVHMALHFALFLGPYSISLFGCDNKIIGDKSHTSKLDYYNGGKIWTDSDQTKKRLSFYDSGIDQLGRLALSLGIPLIRVGHA
jgi:hypothetical protein